MVSRWLSGVKIVSFMPRYRLSIVSVLVVFGVAIYDWLALHHWPDLSSSCCTRRCLLFL
jgi:hypothetical protein